MQRVKSNLIWFEHLKREDVAQVGGKNASLGEMVSALAPEGIKVPPGFATTAEAYRTFIAENALGALIAEATKAWDEGRASLHETGSRVRAAIIAGHWPTAIEDELREAYRQLGERVGQVDPSVAVRSSATAEDLPDASFAGQQETFLNVRGEAALLAACRRCIASLFTDRAIEYRHVKGFSHTEIALSVGVQMMVRADTGSSGVMFSLDTETGFQDLVLINAAWGLGENVVQGTVDPDEYQVFKPFLDTPGRVPILQKSLGAKKQKMIYGARGTTRNVPTSRAERTRFVLDDADILTLARYSGIIERHYGMPMDMEWAKDGETGEIYIVQARPETVQSQATGRALRSYDVTPAGKKLLEGLSVGNAAAVGEACLIESAADIDKFVEGSVLVTSSTDPDWMPIMKQAAAIITDHGGRTSHAAIVSRELGLPAIVGTGNATQLLHDQQALTVDCTEGDRGTIYAGRADITTSEIALDDVPETRTKILLNLANPSAAMRWWRLPVDGVGLARMEFVINNEIKVHPMALVDFDRIEDEKARASIKDATQGYDDREQFFVERLSMGLSRIAAVWYPKPVIVRMSDFKSNEYAKLLGGRQFEPHEENPMIGFRGASRYYSDAYRAGFALECRAIKRLREDMGFDNVIVMIPFCRSPEEADKVLAVMKEQGVERGQNGLQVYVMAEVPSNIVRARDFAERFDGFSIGSNDLTQLTLGVDRDSERLADLFRERDPAVVWMIETLISSAHETGSKVGLCGQAPSNDPEFSRLLVAAGIDSISVTPDSFIAVKTNVAAAERAEEG